MAALFRQYFLFLTVLLTALGNMSALSFCECNEGIFIGSCACEQEHAQSVDSFENTGSLPHSTSVSIGTHHCHHVSLANDNQAQVTPPTLAQLVPTPQFTVPSEFFVERDLLPALPLLREVDIPPDRPLNLSSGAIGYCRPMLI